LGDFLSVCLSIPTSIPHSGPFGLAGCLGLRPGWLGPRPDWLDLSPGWLGLSPGWPRGGDGRTNRSMENLPILQNFVPYRGRCPKTGKNLMTKFHNRAEKNKPLINNFYMTYVRLRAVKLLTTEPSFWHFRKSISKSFAWLITNLVR